MTTLEGVQPLDPALLVARLDARTQELLERRRRRTTVRRGWLVRRALVAADVAALVAAFAATELAVGAPGLLARLSWSAESAIFLAALPIWVLAAKLHGLYDQDEERTDHTTADELVGVFHSISAGVWVLVAGAWAFAIARPELGKVILFWALAVSLVAGARVLARAYCRRQIHYLQNTLVLGAGDVGQLVARKLLQHPEYGINLVGLVDDCPKERRPDLGHVTVIGEIGELEAIVRTLDVERVIVAFSNHRSTDLLPLLRRLDALEVQVDIVPRFYEVVGLKAGVHSVEGIPLVGVPPARLPRSSRALKRALDVAVALVALLLAAPFFAYAAWRICRESDGPVFFRQTRLGMNMREFTALKFRTMHADTPSDEHERFIERVMDAAAAPERSGLYKLEQSERVTAFGRFLRRTSLDELPQLLNVLRGEMSLVGPRPCIPYETKHFEEHHFDRFAVPAGITGLWQVKARARSTFREALDMDVAYARSWSLGLDLRLIALTPLQLVRSKATR